MSNRRGKRSYGESYLIHKVQGALEGFLFLLIYTAPQGRGNGLILNPFQHHLHQATEESDRFPGEMDSLGLLCMLSMKYLLLAYSFSPQSPLPPFSVFETEGAGLEFLCLVILQHYLLKRRYYRWAPPRLACKGFMSVINVGRLEDVLSRVDMRWRCHREV